MLLPIKPICERKKARKDGTSIIFIQYCYSPTNRTNLNTELAIPFRFWNKKNLSISSDLPIKYGSADNLNNELKRMFRLAEDLVELATRKGVGDKGHFVKNAWRTDIDIAVLEKNEEKINVLSGEKQEVNLDVFFQIDEYIKSKQNKVTNSTITVLENMKSHLKAFEDFRGKPFSFESFDYSFYDSYVDFLTTGYVQSRFKKPVIGMKPNTIGKTIKQFKIFIKDRIKRKIIPYTDLTDYKAPDEETDAIYLAFEEIASIYYADLAAYPDLIPDRNWFVVACLTGLRFSDFSTLERENLRNGSLYKKQNKSDSWVVI